MSRLAEQGSQFHLLEELQNEALVCDGLRETNEFLANQIVPVLPGREQVSEIGLLNLADALYADKDMEDFPREALKVIVLYDMLSGHRIKRGPARNALGDLETSSREAMGRILLGWNNFVKGDRDYYGQPEESLLGVFAEEAARVVAADDITKELQKSGTSLHPIRIGEKIRQRQKQLLASAEYLKTKIDRRQYSMLMPVVKVASTLATATGG